MSYTHHQQYLSLHTFLAALEDADVLYPPDKDKKKIIRYFGASALQANHRGCTPLMRMASNGYDGLAKALVNIHPKAAEAVDPYGRPVWYYCVTRDPHPPAANSIAHFRTLISFDPLPNGDHPTHILARDFLAVEAHFKTEYKRCLFQFIKTPEDLLVANGAGERVVDLLSQRMDAFTPHEQEFIQQALNEEQHRRLSSEIDAPARSAMTRKI